MSMLVWEEHQENLKSGESGSGKVAGDGGPELDMTRII